jgi:hypothetical protein
MRNDGLIKTFYSTAAITKHRLVIPGSADNTCTEASAATGLLIGVCADLGAGAAGEPVDIILDGIANVEYGGDVTRGQLLTSDGSGRAITATASAGANIRIVGVAMVSGAVGDIGSVKLSQGSLQG